MQKRMPRDHFSTAHLIPRLAQRSARGGVVTVSAQALKFILHMGSTMVLARLLTPTDFGLLAMVAFFTGIIGLFADLGLSAATVQRGEIRHSQVSTLFWLNVAFSLVLMLLAAAAAPLIAWFYGESVLLLVTIAISTTYIWGGLSAQHLALLRRQMRFGALATVEVGGFLVGAVAAISVALMGGGYWALVVLAVGQAFGMAVLAFTFSGWRPGRWLFDADVREMVSFGGNIIGARFMNYLTRNADNLLIGKAWGAAELGIYSRAYALLLMPMQQINGPIAA
jgi:O-antigen/teichoic acid export membrane protein